MSSIQIRDAGPGDRAAIVAIYNHYIRTSQVTFDTRPFAEHEREGWFRQFDHAGRHRLLVAERGGTVRGYAASSRLRPKPAYERSVETTIYLDPAATGAGIGRQLYGALLEQLPAAGVHRAYGVIALPNPVSIALHLRLGFHHAGTFGEVGYKFGRYWDVAWYERCF